VNRLKVILRGTSYDIFAQDVYCYKLCYVSFTYSYEKKTLVPDEKETKKIQEEVMDKFFRLFQRKVIDNHGAYLLTELVLDIKEMSEDHELAEPPILKTFTLWKILTECYGDAVTFGKIGNRIVVDSSDVSSRISGVGGLVGNVLAFNARGPWFESGICTRQMV